MTRHAVLAAVLGLTVTSLACGESREDQLRRQIQYEKAGKKEVDPLAEVEKIPPHPTRDALAPLLTKIFSGENLPNVVETEIVGVAGERFPYELTAGVLAVVRLKSGLSEAQKVKAIVRGTAEADAWVHRDNARKNYADHIHKVMRSFGDEEKDKVLRSYADLKLLNFFNSADADAAISALPSGMQGAVSALKQEYVGEKDAVWERWMDVKMYARREVAGDRPFKELLKAIRVDLGHEEPKPYTWDEAHDPIFAKWAKEINSDEKLFELMTNLRELQPQEEFRNDTHALWVMEGSPKMPAKAKGVKTDKMLGFGVHREDLGGGYQEMVFVFSKKLKGAKLKRAYLQSHIYRHIFSDFQLLATAGSDFPDKIVPDKYDPEYARCASGAALDTMLTHYKGKYPLIADLSPKTRDAGKILTVAHECIIEACRGGGIKIPDPKDETDVEGPAPGSRLAVFQMLARFETVDYNAAALRKEPKKSAAEMDAEAFLKANPNQHVQ
ncbi:MAG: hypothetical protein B7733_14780 [Myxococcales bacterium FL481]|nr:MAG: hypothetical protein B7733_14780 [Myxococcales bacterium FL481]